MIPPNRPSRRRPVTDLIAEDPHVASVRQRQITRDTQQLDRVKLEEGENGLDLDGADDGAVLLFSSADSLWSGTRQLTQPLGLGTAPVAAQLLTLGPTLSQLGLVIALPLSGLLAGLRVEDGAGAPLFVVQASGALHLRDRFKIETDAQGTATHSTTGNNFYVTNLQTGREVFRVRSIGQSVISIQDESLDNGTVSHALQLHRRSTGAGTQVGMGTGIQVFLPDATETLREAANWQVGLTAITPSISTYSLFLTRNAGTAFSSLLLMPNGEVRTHTTSGHITCPRYVATAGGLHRWDVRIAGDEHDLALYDPSGMNSSGGIVCRVSPERLSTGSKTAKIAFGRHELASPSGNSVFFTIEGGDNVTALGGVAVSYFGTASTNALALSNRNSATKGCRLLFNNLWLTGPDVLGTGASGMFVAYDNLYSRNRIYVKSENEILPKIGFGTTNPQAVLSIQTSTAIDNQAQRLFHAQTGNDPANQAINIEMIRATGVSLWNYLFLNGTLGSASMASGRVVTSTFANTWGLESGLTEFSVISAPNGTNQTIQRLLKFDYSGGNYRLGVFDHTPAIQQTVTGSLSGGTALASLLAALSAYGIIVDNTTS